MGWHRKHAELWHDAENGRNRDEDSCNPPHPRLKYRGAGIGILLGRAPVEVDGDKRSETYDDVARCAEQL